MPLCMGFGRWLYVFRVLMRGTDYSSRGWRAGLLEALCSSGVSYAFGDNPKSVYGRVDGRVDDDMAGRVCVNLMVLM